MTTDSGDAALAADLIAVRRELSAKYQLDSPRLNQVIAALESRQSVLEALEELRKRIERESYWCEDCQKEIPKKEWDSWTFGPPEHTDCEVVKVTVVEGWITTELEALLKNAQRTEGSG